MTYTLGLMNEDWRQIPAPVCVQQKVGSLSGHDGANRGSLQKFSSPLPPAQVRPVHLDLDIESWWARECLWWTARV